MNTGKFITSTYFKNKNHQLIRYERGTGLFSYNSLVVLWLVDGIYLGKDWDYSKTTVRHVVSFLGTDVKTIREKLSSGEYKTIDGGQVKDTRYLYISIAILDGEREHTHRLLHSTRCKDLNFAVEWYAAHYWGIGQYDNGWWFDNRTFVANVTKWVELSEEEYKMMFNIMY